MKATFALLLDYHIHNYMRRLAYEINRDYGVGFYGAQLPPHISLKQPFAVEEIDKVEKYFDELAASIQPFRVQITELAYWVSEQMGSIFLRVDESPILRKLHNRINKELAERFANTKALFDGEEYRFHATIALGGSAPKEVYREYYDKLQKSPVNFNYTAREIVMFYYDDDSYKIGSFITYKVLPLGTFK